MKPKRGILLLSETTSGITLRKNGGPGLTIQFLEIAHIIFTGEDIKEKGSHRGQKNAKKGERNLQYGQKLDDKGVNRENYILKFFLSDEPHNGSPETSRDLSSCVGVHGQREVVVRESHAHSGCQWRPGTPPDFRIHRSPFLKKVVKLVKILLVLKV